MPTLIYNEMILHGRWTVTLIYDWTRKMMWHFSVNIHRLQSSPNVKFTNTGTLTERCLFLKLLKFHWFKYVQAMIPVRLKLCQKSKKRNTLIKNTSLVSTYRYVLEIVHNIDKVFDTDCDERMRHGTHGLFSFYFRGIDSVSTFSYVLSPYHPISSHHAQLLVSSDTVVLIFRTLPPSFFFISRFS